MKCLKLLTVAGVAGALMLAASVSNASTLWLSSSANPVTASNETIAAANGQNFTLYLWAQMSANQSFTGLSLDIKMSTNGVVARTGTPAASYSTQNPNNGLGNRWSSTGTGNSGLPSNLLIDNANAVNINGSNMGFASPPSNDPTYNAATNSYLVSTLSLVMTSSSSVNLFLGVGTSGITFKNAPGGTNLAASTTINFGFGDAPIAGNDSRRSVNNANSTLADFTINIPEPSSIVMGLMGLCAFAGIAIRCRRS